MRVTVWVSLVLGIVMTWTTGASADLVNGGFETGDATGWTPSTEHNKDSYATWGMFVQSDVKHSGDYAYLIHHDAQANTQGRSIWQNVDLSGGDDLSFWLNVDLNPNNSSWPTSAGSYAGVDIRAADYGAVIANLVTIGGGVPSGSSSAHYGTNGWQLYEFDLSSYGLPDQVSLSFWLSTYNNLSRTNERIYIDDVSVVPLPPAMVLGALGIGSSLVGLLRRRKTV